MDLEKFKYYLIALVMMILLSEKQKIMELLSIPPNYLDTFSKISQILLLVTLILALRQLNLSRRQMQEDHKARRLSATISITERWLKSSKEGFIYAVNVLLAQLSIPDIKCIVGLKPFAIPSTLKPFITTIICSDQIRCGKHCIECNVIFSSSTTTNNDSMLTEYATIMIHRQVSDYFNQLEQVFYAWFHSIADRDIIEDEFKQILKRSNLVSMLNVFDPDAKLLPYTHQFIFEMNKQDKHEKPPTGK